MRFKPKFEPTLEERPDIFNINMISDYVGGTRKVWGSIVQNEIYKDIFVKVKPIGISYSFKTKLSRQELEELYLKDIARRQLISTAKANVTKALQRKSKLII